MNIQVKENGFLFGNIIISDTFKSWKMCLDSQKKSFFYSYYTQTMPKVRERGRGSTILSFDFSSVLDKAKKSCLD